MSNPAVLTTSDWVLATVTAATGGLDWFDGHVPSTTSEQPLPTRYGVLYTTTPTRTWDDLAHTSDSFRAEWQITAVGSTRAEAEWIATKARDALVDRRPVVAGLVFDPIEQVSSQPIRWDDQVPGRVVLYGTDQYGCNATLA